MKEPIRVREEPWDTIVVATTPAASDAPPPSGGFDVMAVSGSRVIMMEDLTPAPVTRESWFRLR